MSRLVVHSVYTTDTDKTGQDTTVLACLVRVGGVN